MTHNLSLTLDRYNTVELYLVTKHIPTYSAGDTLIVTLEGHRDQRIFTIAKVLAGAEKINLHWCILLLDAQELEEALNHEG